MLRICLSLILACLALAPQLSVARVLRVGPDEEFTRIAEAARKAGDGDTVEIHPGVYKGDVVLWLQRRLTLRGVGERPVIVADGRNAEGKGIWVIRKGDFTVENLEFRGARVADGNGAGIRFEGGRLRIVNCSFFDNQNGILTNNAEGAELIIEGSVFASAPRSDESLHHLLYVGRIGSLSVTGSRFHAGYRGHLVKSRAERSDLRYNLIIDGPGGAASYEAEFPNGGEVTLVGNVIGQSAETMNPVMVAYGAEGAVWPRNRLALSHNTFLAAGWHPAWFVRVWQDQFKDGLQVVTVNNLISGIGLFNLLLPGIHQGNFHVLQSVFGAPEILDFSLATDSWLRGWAKPMPREAGVGLEAVAEFQLPVGIRPVEPGRQLVPGAVQVPSISRP